MPRGTFRAFVGAVLMGAWSLGAAGFADAKEDSDLERAGAKARQLLQRSKDAGSGPSREPIPTRDATPAGRAASAAPVELRIVVFSAAAAKTSGVQRMAAMGLNVLKDLRLINAVTVAVPAASAKALDAGLDALPGVERVEKDFRQNWLLAGPGPGALPLMPGRMPPDVKATAEEFAALARARQHVPWGVDRANARSAWERSRGEGVRLAVVDTGVDTSHPDLKVAGGFGTSGPYKDDNGHGTHVAGTIAAMDNREGVVGVAPAVELYAVKVLDADGSGTFSDVIEGIQWCAENGIQVANMSLGAGIGTQALAEAVAAATSAGTVIIAAAGNSGGSVGFPAAYPQTVAVAAMSFGGQVADFSSRGPEVDLIAPGVDVLSTYMGGRYETLSGTSMATPHVAGLAALAIGARGARGREEVFRALARAASPLEDVPGEQQGWGMVDARRLLPER